MTFWLWKIAVLPPLVLGFSSVAHALEDGGGTTADGPAWSIDDIAARRVQAPTVTYSLSRTQAWANGLVASRMSAFTPSGVDKAVGAKMQPFQDWNFLIGTELIRSSGESRFLSSKAMWETSWSQDWESLGGLRVVLSTTGSLDNAQADYLQSFSGNLNVPLDLPLNAWDLEFRLSPTMNVDMSQGSLTSNLMSELVGKTILSSHNAAFRSTLDVSVGYSIAPEARPAASAQLQLTISPNL